MIKYSILVFALYFPSLLEADIDECSIQQDHCSITEALFKIDALERSLFKEGPWPWSVKTPIGGRHYPGDSQ